MTFYQRIVCQVSVPNDLSSNSLAVNHKLNSNDKYFSNTERQWFACSSFWTVDGDFARI